jgi:acyl-CoA synthetase (AMP-forming)/AMP-acid ligase II
VTGWSFATVWEAVARRFPEAPAWWHGEAAADWAGFERRAEALAQGLVAAGLAPGDRVGELVGNHPAYLETFFAASKARLVPVNLNYRYTAEELRGILQDAEPGAVVVQGAYVDRAAPLVEELGFVRRWLWVDDGNGSCPSWAEPYEALAGAGPDPARRTDAAARSGDDLVLLYTGGTTGQPKGVMWPQDGLFRMLEELQGAPVPAEADPEGYAARLTRPGPGVLPAAPLMHGTGLFFVLPVLSRGGAVRTLPSQRFDPVEVLTVLSRERLKGLCIVGDAFARPLVAALEAEPARYDLSALRVVFSSGLTFSAETKSRLLRFAPRAVVVDSLGSSESGGMARTLTSAQDLSGGETEEGGAVAPRFRVGGRTRVVDDEGRDVVPGSGQVGRLAVAGHLPLGYWRDPEKTASTFLVLGGVRHVVAGDYATVEAGGTIRLLGRGSVCINTGGEKVYPDEVEAVVKAAPGVRDCVVVGVPDERFGEVVTAVVEPEPGARLELASLADACRPHLAGYKLPRRLVVLPEGLGRAANGKADYRRLRALAQERLATPTR